MKIKILNFLIELYMRLGMPALCWCGVKYCIPESPFYENILGFIACLFALIAGHNFCGGVRDGE